MEENKNKSGKPIASLVLGIISIITCPFWYSALITSILAIIFGSISIRKWGSKLGKAGLITGIIGISMCAFIYISIAMILIVSNIY